MPAIDHELRPNKRMQLTGRRVAQHPVRASFRLAAVEALVCEPWAFTARS